MGITALAPNSPQVVALVTTEKVVAPEKYTVLDLQPNIGTDHFLQVIRAPSARFNPQTTNPDTADPVSVNFINTHRPTDEGGSSARCAWWQTVAQTYPMLC